MPDLASEIAEYARNVCRANSKQPVKRMELIADIMRDAQATKGMWPIATVGKWKIAIDEAVKRGLLQRVSETIWIPAVVKEPKAKQGELF